MEESFLSILLFLSFAILAGWISVQRLTICWKMAPGPFTLPLLGPLMATLNRDAISVFQKYKDKYGKVFSLSVGNYYLTVVTDYKLILSSLKRPEFEGRPDYAIWGARNGGAQHRGILFCSGPTWKEQRRFALKTLRNFGFGKESQEGMLIHELNELRGLLRKDIGRPIDLEGVFNASVINSLWVILTGKRFELEDPALKTLIHLTIKDVKDFLILHPAYFLNPLFTLVFSILKVFHYKFPILEKMRALLDAAIDEHLATYVPGQARDFIDEYIQQVWESQGGSSFHGEEGKQNLQIVLYDFFAAGTETTATTLLWAVLYLTSYPEVQRKLTAEIDAVIGRSRPPNRSDKASMIYLEAVLNEVHRMASILPYSVYHKAVKDSEIGGYLVPQDSVVFFSIRDAHHDPGVWGDPHIFRPERFLDASGTKPVKYEALMPFSNGKRQCLGETLARDTLFIFLAGLLQSFCFEFDPSCPKVDLRGSSSFISTPKPFKVILTERHK